ncbi:hypothetical protein [Pedobacter sp. L105]|uniref:hypothetical protein n=1 Tax=Pedobacter sp. L105 TaxID=1641871 RepID=UPI00131B4C4F|nr:hypothetical protein [Pedobacter sp. L105]
MKNFILSAAILAFAGVSTVKANEIRTPIAIVIQQDSSAKVPVKLEALPAPVQTTLKADAYKEWTPTTAFLITEADKTAYYQVNVKKGQEVAFLKVGKDGTVLQ